MRTIILKWLAWLILGLCLAATMVPIGGRPHIGLPPDAERSLAFLALGLLFGLAYPRQRLLIAIGLVAGAFALEATQYLQPTRHPRLDDASIKAAGALVGMFAAWVVARVTMRPSKG